MPNSTVRLSVMKMTACPCSRGRWRCTDSCGRASELFIASGSPFSRREPLLNVHRLLWVRGVRNGLGPAAAALEQLVQNRVGRRVLFHEIHTRCGEDEFGALVACEVLLLFQVPEGKLQ